MMADRTAIAAGVVMLLALPVSAVAQQPAPGSPPIRRLEISIGAGMLGGGGLGVQDANLRANNAAPEAFRLFRTETRFAASPAFDLRAGFAFTPRYGVEGGVSFGHPELRTSISDDAEGAEALDVFEDVDQYLFGAALRVTLDRLRFGSLVPVVTVGGGYLRQLHEGRTVVEDGRFLQGSVGLRHAFAAAGRGLVKGAGVRADGRLYLVDGGIEIDNGVRPQAAVSGSVFVIF